MDRPSLDASQAGGRSNRVEGREPAAVCVLPSAGRGARQGLGRYHRPMRPVITPAEAARLDRESPEPVEVLMERAGFGVARHVAGLGIGYGSRVAVLVGPGNNGGDGYVAARHLRRRGVAAEVHLLEMPKTDAARWAAGRAAAAHVPVRPLGRPRGEDLVIDAVFGGGFRHGIPPALLPWMDAQLPVVAVDVPTGLDPAEGSVLERAFTAVLTVTFGAVRTGHVLGEGPDRCGRVEVVDIGLGEPTPAMRIVDDEDAPRPRRPRAAHKWSAGSVLVVGGAPGMVGAAILAARSALRFGAGAVGVASPQRDTVATVAPEVLSYAFGEALEAADRFDVVVVGPGLGRDQGELVTEMMRRRAGPLLLDADGLFGLTGAQLAGRNGPTILTPHAGEFRRLAGVGADPATAVSFAADTGTVVVLKGNPTFVTSGGAPWVVDSGGPELATIGTGDVLSGMIGALWSRGLSPLAAARSAAYWHGRAGAALAAEGVLTADRLAAGIARWGFDGEHR